ncbi:MAG: hypothetical protein JWN43_385 [Gammaproteobacteria bacterium]|nr:hypothetical protein [Gammaproteobacteria bacterium]
MHILAVLLSILILAAVVFYGLLALLRQSIDDSPFAAPASSVADALQQPAAQLTSSEDAERGSRGESCT